jgi:acetyl-CoA C-acetyltransferase
MESMTNAPYALKKARFGYRLGDGTLIDLTVHDGLTSSFDHRHMIQQASFVSRELGIAREDQDRWALRSHQRAVNAMDNGLFDPEIVPVDGVSADESPRRDTSYEKLAKLRPVFDPDGTTTAGNAPSINDGAAAVVVTSEEFARERGLEVLATILSPGLRRRRVRLSGADAGQRRQAGAREGGKDDRRRRAGRAERGVRLRRAELVRDARRRSRRR